MTSKIIKLTPEQQKRLLELVAEEEEALEALGLTDEELKREEEIVSKQIEELLKGTSQKSLDDGSESASLPHKSPSPQRSKKN